MIPLRYNIRSLFVRRTTTLMTGFAVALVVMILFMILGFLAGLRDTVLATGRSGNWILLSRGVTSEPGSYITREQYEIIRARSEVATDRSGEALLSPEMVNGFFADPDAPMGDLGFTFIRGVYPIAYKVHRGMKLESGRWPNKSAAELVVGQRLAARHPNLATGRTLRFGRRTWNIVGSFSDNGSVHESEVWTDLDVLQQDLRFGVGAMGVISLILRPGTADSFKAALTKDARLRVEAKTEEQFYAEQSQFVNQLRGLGIVLAAILGIGATFGGMNTMYTAVARRSKEIGVLRALGFTRANILLSFVAESVILALMGGIAGELLGVGVATAAGLTDKLVNVGMYIFSFRLAPSAFVAGLAAATIIGALGGLLPAWRAARIGVIDSLREA
jgi:hypothetical protein